MKVTITEALRIQKEISTIISRLTYQQRQVSYGILKQDGAIISDTCLQKFPDFVSDLKKVFHISETINSVIAQANHTFDICSKVRQRENLKSLIVFYETAIQSLPAPTSTKVVPTGNGNQTVRIVTEFEPHMSKAEIKAQIKETKTRIRAIQSEIDSLNAQIIELPFEYEDLDVFVADGE